MNRKKILKGIKLLILSLYFVIIVVSDGETNLINETAEWVIRKIDNGKKITNIFITVDNQNVIYIGYLMRELVETTGFDGKQYSYFSIDPTLRYIKIKGINITKENIVSSVSLIYTDTFRFGIDKSGIPYATYYDSGNSNFYYFRRYDDKWSYTIPFQRSLLDLSIFSVVFDSKQNSHLLYYYQSRNINDQGYIYAKEIGGKWTEEILPSSLYIDKGSLLIDKNDQVSIISKGLKYIKKIGGTWTVVNDIDNVYVFYYGISLDKDDNIHIIYICSTNNASNDFKLKYAKLENNIWKVEKIIDLSRVTNGVNFSLDFKLGEDNYAYIIYGWKDLNIGNDMKFLKWKFSDGGTTGSVGKDSTYINTTAAIGLNSEGVVQTFYGTTDYNLFYATQVKKIAESREDKLIPVNNLFNSSTGDKATIIYKLSQQGLARVRIYTINGELIRTLVEEEKTEGTYTVEWDGKDEFGGIVGSGLYFVVFEAPNVKEVKKICVVK